MFLRDGFPGQRLHVLPSPLIRQALTRKPTSRLLVTDAGHFPHAARHGRQRKHGSAQVIVMLCVDGVGWCDLAGGRHQVGAGDAVVIPPRTPHLYYADDTRPWTIWWMHVTGEDLPDLLDAIDLPTSGPTVRINDDYRALTLMEHVVDSLGRDETMASLTNAAGSAWNLLALLAAERAGRGLGTEPVRRAQDCLRENLQHPIAVRLLAERAGLSTSHFSARFRSLTGYSVTEYVKRLRMARARQRLITTEHSIAEIGSSVGYPDAFYFSRQFRIVHGVSPSEFRSRAQDEASGGSGEPTTPAPRDPLPPG